MNYSTLNWNLPFGGVRKHFLLLNNTNSENTQNVFIYIYIYISHVRGQIIWRSDDTSEHRMTSGFNLTLQAVGNKVRKNLSVTFTYTRLWGCQNSVVGMRLIFSKQKRVTQ